MQTIFNLEQYLSNGIENLVKNTIKSTLRNPQKSAFLLKYIVSARKASKIRAASEKRGEHIPPFLIASITSKCNLFCTGCYSKAADPSGKNELESTDWARLFAEAGEIGIAMILLAGGEPFMRPDVINQAANRPEILFPIFTNGTVLREQEYSMLNTYRNLIPIISIEGGETITDTRRGGGVYLQTMNAMRKLDGMDILFGASVTVTSKNLAVVTSEAFVDDLYSKGCKIILYIEYVPFELESLALTDAERGVLEDRTAALREKEMIFISFPGDEKDTGGCLAAGRGFFHIASDGNAEPCPFSPYSDINVRNATLKEALLSPLFTKLKSGGILREEQKGGCVLFEKKETVKRLVTM